MSWGPIMCFVALGWSRKETKEIKLRTQEGTKESRVLRKQSFRVSPFVFFSKCVDLRFLVIFICFWFLKLFAQVDAFLKKNYVSWRCSNRNLTFCDGWERSPSTFCFPIIATQQTKKEPFCSPSSNHWNYTIRQLGVPDTSTVLLSFKACAPADSDGYVRSAVEKFVRELNQFNSYIKR